MEKKDNLPWEGGEGEEKSYIFSIVFERSWPSSCIPKDHNLGRGPEGKKTS